MVLRTLGLMVAVLLVAVGVLWTAQGLGYVEGSSMTGNRDLVGDRARSSPGSASRWGSSLVKPRP